MTAQVQFRWSLVACIAIGLSSVSVSSAQDIQHFRHATGTWNYFSVDGAQVSPVGQATVGLSINYARNPLVQRDENGRIVSPIVSDLTTFEVMGTFGLGKRLDVGLALPFGHAKKATDLSVDDGGGFGDLRLIPKLIIAGAEERIGLAVAVVTPMTFPTGNDDDEHSSRHFVMSPKLVFEYRARSWRAATYAGYRWLPSQDEDLPALALGNGAMYGFALGIKPVGPRLEILAESFATAHRESDAAVNGPHPVEGLLGFRFFAQDGLAFSLGAGGGFTREFSSPEFRMVGAFSWALGRSYGPANTSWVSDQDRDGDGVKDVADACPELAEDRDGFQDADGCPDTDNDADGIADTSDRCPVRPEDFDGREDADGCPELDNDGDGIPDRLDRCPEHPENRNGVSDDDGCPDDVKVVVEKGRIRHLKRIYFDTNSASIKAESFPVLSEVARVMKRQTQIRLVRIDGHTDAFGSDDHNIKLAEERANAVRRFLIEAGVESKRLEVRGHGESNPIGDGRSQSNARLSRRVEFIILQRQE